jgi:hypothetical protein
VDAEILTGSLIELNDGNVVGLNPSLEFSGVGQTNNRMVVTLSRHVVNKIDQAILQAAYCQPLDHMSYQRRLSSSK